MAKEHSSYFTIYQLLKEKESKTHNLDWNLRRLFTKLNWRLLTDAVKEYVIPISNLPKNKEKLVYAEEADILNLALFGCTAKEWREANGITQERCDNIRDCADIVQLIVLANLEIIHATLLREGRSAEERYNILAKSAEIQKKAFYADVLDHSEFQSPNLIKESDSSFDKSLKGLLNTPPPTKKK